VIRALLGDERGYSAVELLTVAAVMTIVLGAITGLFVAGAHGELDSNRRFQAQNNARLGLDRLRRDVHCSESGTPSGPTDSVTLNLPSYCRSGSGPVTWCVQTTSGRKGLFRVTGSTCTGGVKLIDYLVVNSGTNVFCFTPSSTVRRAVLKVSLAVNLEPVTRPYSTYLLRDQIAFRNTTLSGFPSPSPC
jgi:Tfp pilus assembly protein PilW